jgi:hypothetical protein
MEFVLNAHHFLHVIVKISFYIVDIEEALANIVIKKMVASCISIVMFTSDIQVMSSGPGKHHEAYG